MLEYDEDTAGGMMNTEYIAVDEHASVAEAVETIRQNPDLFDALNTLFLIDSDGRLKAALSLARVCLASAEARLQELVPEEPVIHASVEDKAKKVIELVDKYNLMTLPVLDDEGRLAGVVTADDIISVLRRK